MRPALAPMAASCLLALAAAPGALAAEKATVGNAATVVRTVTGTFQTDIRQIVYLDDLYHNELVETGADSATEIIFLDDTRLAMGPDSSLVLDKFVYDPNPDQSSFVVTATEGVFRFASGKLPKKSYTIHTPTATIGIRGTAFTLSVRSADGAGTPAAVELVLESGTALVTPCGGETFAIDAPSAASVRLEAASGACLPALQ